jgi:hypothetical protein
MTVTERLDKHDKQIASIRDLLKEGIKMVLETSGSLLGRSAEGQVGPSKSIE